MKPKKNVLVTCFVFLSLGVIAQLTEQKKVYTKADTLRGSLTEFRRGWDVMHYDLNVAINIVNRSISGSNRITYYENLAIKRIQIDLQSPLVIDSIISDNGE